MPKKAAKNGPTDEVIIQGYQEYQEGGGSGVGNFIKSFFKPFGTTKLHMRNVLAKNGPTDEVIIQGYQEYQEGGGSGVGNFIKSFFKPFGTTKLHMRNVLEK